MPNGDEIHVIEHDDGWYHIEVIVGGKALTPHGPFADHDEAEGAAAHLAGVCRVMGQVMSIVTLPAPRQCA